MYLYNYATGYSAIYRSIDEYEKLFCNAGVAQLHKAELGASETCGLRFKSVGYVWEKQ